jgi:hypothetical protein
MFLLCQISYSLVECGLIAYSLGFLLMMIFSFVFVVFSTLEEWIVRIEDEGIQSFQRYISLVDRYILGAHDKEKHL